MLPICYICLQSNVKLLTMEDRLDLLHFYDELCDYNFHFQDFFYQFCSECMFKLKKALDFKNKCQLAHDTLRAWRKTRLTKRISIHELHKEMPSSRLGLCNRRNLKVYYYQGAGVDMTGPIEMFSNRPHIVNLDITKDDNFIMNTTYIDNIMDTNVVETNVMPSHVMPSNVMPSNVMPSSVMPSNVMPSEVMISNVMTSNVMTSGIKKELEADVHKVENSLLKVIEPDFLDTEDNMCDKKIKVEFCDESYEPELSGDEQSLSGDERNLSGDERNLSGDERNSSDDERNLSDEKGISGDEIDKDLEKAMEDDTKYDSDKSLKELLTQIRKKKALKKETENKELEISLKKEKDEEFVVTRKRRARDLRKKREKEKIKVSEKEKFKKVLMSKFKISDSLQEDKRNVATIDSIIKNLDKMPSTDRYIQRCRRMIRPGPLTLSDIKKLTQLQSKFIEFASVFDVENLSTMAEVRAEFARRRTYPDYVNTEHRCELCITGFRTRRRYEFHSRILHNPALPYPCDLCKMRFKKKKQLSWHFTRLHKAVFRCKRCEYIVNNREDMEKHFRKHEGLKYKCEHCPDTEFTLKNQWYIHMNKFHKEDKGPYMYCEFCAFATYSSIGLTLHKDRLHSSKEPMKKFHKEDKGPYMYCEFCAFATYSSIGLTLHKDRLHSSEIFIEGDHNRKCIECDTTFINESVYQTHVRKSHMSEDDMAKGYQKRVKIPPFFSCRLCHAKGTSPGPGWLMNHFRREHPTEDMETIYGNNKKFLCDECGKGFRLKCFLIDHMNTHTGIKPYECDECPKAFYSRRRLYYHKERHLPPSQCDICGKGFRSKSNLNSHKLIHKGDKCHKCEHCGKGFLLRTALNAHIRGVHLNIRRKRKSANE